MNPSSMGNQESIEPSQHMPSQENINFIPRKSIRLNSNQIVKSDVSDSNLFDQIGGGKVDFEDEDSFDEDFVEEFTQNQQFKNYQTVFNNLLKYTTIETDWPIIKGGITYDSTQVISVTKMSISKYLIRLYDIETYNVTFQEEIGSGKEEEYVKIKNVQ